MAKVIPFALRTSTGLHVVQGPPKFGPLEQFTPLESKSCRVCTFSPNGLYFAYAFDYTLKLVRTDSWTEVATIQNVKVYNQAFSPKSTFLVTWEHPVIDNKMQGTPNMTLYNCATGEAIKHFPLKVTINWEPIWSEDEKLFTKMQGTDLLFYEDSNFERVVNRTKGFKVASYSISMSQGAYNIACHVPGSTSQPSFGKMFKYPNLDPFKAVSNKGFFQCDNVAYFWNHKGNYCLLLTSTEQDKTGQSYYGKQSLHFMDINGQTNTVPLPKEGAIHSVAWSPKANEFCVVYGSMPARASIFDRKCEPIRELGAGPRNTIHYNPHGNILLLGGFGNLRGSVQLWDTTTNKIIGNCDCSDTTWLEWCPDGVHFLTATTSPRLRIGNGYKIWHYSGALLHEKDVDQLHQATWLKFDKGVLPEPALTADKIEGIASTKVQASSLAYRPPSARNKPTISFNLHDHDAETGKKIEPIVSKSAMKARKSREARKARKEDENKRDGVTGVGVVKPVVDKIKIEVISTGDAAKDKKIHCIEKKLKDIIKLKDQQKQGKTLEANQLTKIKGEEGLLKELKQLQI